MTIEEKLKKRVRRSLLFLPVSLGNKLILQILPLVNKIRNFLHIQHPRKFTKPIMRNPNKKKNVEMGSLVVDCYIVILSRTCCFNYLRKRSSPTVIDTKPKLWLSKSLLNKLFKLAQLEESDNRMLVSQPLQNYNKFSESPPDDDGQV